MLQSSVICRMLCHSGRPPKTIHAWTVIIYNNIKSYFRVIDKCSKIQTPRFASNVCILNEHYRENPGRTPSFPRGPNFLLLVAFKYFLLVSTWMFSTCMDLTKACSLAIFFNFSYAIDGLNVSLHSKVVVTVCYENVQRDEGGVLLTINKVVRLGLCLTLVRKWNIFSVYAYGSFNGIGSIVCWESRGESGITHLEQLMWRQCSKPHYKLPKEYELSLTRAGHFHEITEGPKWDGCWHVSRVSSIVHCPRDGHTWFWTLSSHVLHAWYRHSRREVGYPGLLTRDQNWARFHLLLSGTKTFVAIVCVQFISFQKCR